MNKNRLEAFSDGVMAIIITIMVLEIKMPHGNSIKDLAGVLPAFFSYAQSFWFVGVYWNNHHHLLHTVKRVNGRMMVANMLLLFILSLVPFATSWVSETNFAPTPVAVYAVVLVLAGNCWTILQRHIEKSSNWSEAVQKAMNRQSRKGWVSTILYGLGIPFAFINPYVSEAFFVLVAIMWLLPDKNIEAAFALEKHEG
jgi:uncharacterized membrane protein